MCIQLAFGGDKGEIESGEGGMQAKHKESGGGGRRVVHRGVTVVFLLLLGGSLFLMFLWGDEGGTEPQWRRINCMYCNSPYCSTSAASTRKKELLISKYNICNFLSC